MGACLLLLISVRSCHSSYLIAIHANWYKNVNKKAQPHLRRLDDKSLTRSTDLIFKPTWDAFPKLTLQWLYACLPEFLAAPAFCRPKGILNSWLTSPISFVDIHGCWDTVPDSHRLPILPRFNLFCFPQSSYHLFHKVVNKITINSIQFYTFIFLIFILHSGDISSFTYIYIYALS